MDREKGGGSLVVCKARLTHYPRLKIAVERVPVLVTGTIAEVNELTIRLEDSRFDFRVN